MLHEGLQEADSHDRHGRLDTRISRHAALENRESSYGLSLCKDGHTRQQMGETEDWPIQHHFSIIIQGEEGWGARSWRLHDSQPSERRKEKARGAGAASCTLPYLFLVRWGVCIDGMAVVSGKWDTGRDWRTRSIFVQRLLASGAI